MPPPPLPTFHEDRTFTYTQVERQGDIAIFRQHHKTGGVDRYEVVRIRIAPAHTWPNGDTSPEREVYPGSTSWGQLGWTFHALPAAQHHMQGLLEDTEYATTHSLE